MQTKEEFQTEDELIDAMLREHARGDREDAIHKIENAITVGMLADAKKQPSVSWLRLSISVSVAAAVVLCIGAILSIYLLPGSLKETPVFAFFVKNQSEAPNLCAASPNESIHKKPTAPSSSTTKVITAQTLPQISIPVPEVPVEVPSEDFGLAGDFGDGWGSSGSGGGGGFFGDKAVGREAVIRGYPMEQQANHERYGSLVDQSWNNPLQKPLSTFSIDVDNASYANLRRLIREGASIPKDAVRIEECINAFNYDYEQPKSGESFAVHTDLTTCPWNAGNVLVKIGIKGREIAASNRPASNLVFLIDVSGSMQSPNKLPLVKESLKLLLNQLDERDRVAFVVYASSEGVVLPPTRITGKGRAVALDALNKLHAGGSTNGGAGINRAYELAAKNFIEGGINRVILASDGDFNVGVTSNGALVDLVKKRAAQNIYLSALAFGTGNLNDSMFEAISNEGNGNYFYIDGMRESRRVFLHKLSGTLVTIAKDVKLQVEFNPKLVESYRLIGYANRVLRNEDFANDIVDAGDIGAGHTVTAFYEVVPANSQRSAQQQNGSLKYQRAVTTDVVRDYDDEWLTLKLRHKHPEGDVSSLQEKALQGGPILWQQADGDFQFAAAVAMFGMKLRGMEEASSITWQQVRELAKSGLSKDPNEDRAEFIQLIDTLEARER